MQTIDSAAFSYFFAPPNSGNNRIHPAATAATTTASMSNMSNTYNQNFHQGHHQNYNQGYHQQIHQSHLQHSYIAHMNNQISNQMQQQQQHQQQQQQQLQPQPQQQNDVNMMAAPRAPAPAPPSLDDDYNYSDNEGDYDDDEDEDFFEDSDEPKSVLMNLVLSNDWPATVARTAAFPDECKSIGHQGRNPIHVACDQDAPPPVVDALLRAYPEASLVVGTSNMNPLHITCSSQHASVQIVRVLLEGGHPEQTSMRDVDGDTPLHTACRCGAPIEVIDELIRANPKAVDQRDFEGLTPLLRMWVRYFVILGDDVIDNVKGPADLQGELAEAWKRTILLLRCAHLGSIGPEDHGMFYNYRVLHAASAVDCPRAVVKIASTLYPQQLRERDEHGMTPLLIAAKAPIFKVRDLSDDGYMLEDRIHGDDTYNDAANDDDQESGHPSVIDILLQAHRDAAKVPDNAGLLPLHVAIQSGKKWGNGVKSLLDANPDALCTTDPTNGFVPFLSAAIGKQGDPSTVFELLRKDPAIMQHGAATKEETMMQRKSLKRALSLEQQQQQQPQQRDDHDSMDVEPQNNGDQQHYMFSASNEEKKEQ